MTKEGVGPWARNAFFVLCNRGLAKVLDFVVLLVAARTLSESQLGVVFVAQAAAAVLGSVLGAGLYTVLLRATSRGELSRVDLRRVIGLRFGLLVALALVSAPVWWWAVPSDRLAAFGFFVSAGLAWVHGPGRAVLAGAERFDRLLAITGVTRGLGTGAALAALFTGYGILGWLMARALAEVVQVVLANRWAFRALRAGSVAEGPAIGLRRLLEQGRSFWVSDLVSLASDRVHVLVVSACLGLESAALYGLASRVASAAQLLVASLSDGAFPRWARARARGGRTTAAVFLVNATVVAAGLVAIAPVAAGFLSTSAVSSLTLVIRLLAPAGAIAAISRPLGLWLQAKDRERSVAAVQAVASALGILVLAAVAVEFGLHGAALATAFEGAVLVASYLFVLRMKT